jgi:hypothetical protein
MNFYDDTTSINKGYFTLKKRIPPELARLGLEGSDQIVASAQRGDAPSVRVYRDYPHVFGGLNIFGVEHLMHQSIKSEKFNELFRSLDIEKMVLNVTGWKGAFCTLCRIHTATPFWKYQGTWHRDALVNTDDSIHLNIYLKDEKGFRIVPADRQPLLKERQINETALGNSDNLLLSKDLYDEISAKAGDILFFKSWLLHQGAYCGQRRHIHMCFKRVDNNSQEEVIRVCNINYRKDCDPTNSKVYSKISISTSYNENSSANSPLKVRNLLTQLKPALKRGLRLINYFIPFLRIIRERHLINQSGSKYTRYSFLSNTIWQ